MRNIQKREPSFMCGLIYKLNPTKDQSSYLEKCFAASRRSWNKLVEKFNDLDSVEAMKLSDKVKACRSHATKFKQLPENKWMYDIPSRYFDLQVRFFQEALAKYVKAIKNGDVAKAKARYKENFEKKKAAGAKIKWNERRFNSFYRPKFKSYKDDISIYFDKHSSPVPIVDFEKKTVFFSKKIDPIKFRMPNKDKSQSFKDYEIAKITITRTVDFKYYLNVQFSVFDELPERPSIDKISIQNAVGIDLGVNDYIALSDGKKINFSDFIDDCEGKINRINTRIKDLQLKLSDKEYAKEKRELPSGKKINIPSNNFIKLKHKIAKLHRRKANLRKQAIHLATTYIVENYDFVFTETLGTSRMTRKAKSKIGDDGKTFVRNNKKQKAGLNRGILNRSFHKTISYLKYKTMWKGKTHHQVSKRFASSKICSGCGSKNTQLELSDRIWTCPNCNLEHDRDLNAAINVLNQGLIEIGFIEDGN